MKVIIPVAGEGTRLRPHTLTTPKSLLPVAGKPILGHIIDQIAGLDMSEIVFITGPHGNKIEDFVRQSYSIPTKFVPQEHLYGLGYAVHLGLNECHEEALVILGDTIVEIDWNGLIIGGRNALAVQEVDNPGSFGVVETNGDRITRLVEKPADPPTNKAVVGVYFVRDYQLLLEATTEVIENRVLTHGEVQLTDAFELLLKKGAELYTFPTRAWYDCGRRETILATNRYLLDRMAEDQFAQPAGRAGEVNHPIFVADDVTIEDSIIGPHVSIGAGTVVRSSRIENSIIGENCFVESATLVNSLLGNNVSVKEFHGDLSIGDYSQVGA